MSMTTDAVHEALTRMWRYERQPEHRSLVDRMRELQSDLGDLWCGTFEELQRAQNLGWLLALAEVTAGAADGSLAGEFEDHRLWAEVAQHADEHSLAIEWPSDLQLAHWARILRPMGNHDNGQRAAFSAAYGILWWASWRNRIDNIGYELTPKGTP